MAVISTGGYGRVVLDSFAAGKSARDAEPTFSNTISTAADVIRRSETRWRMANSRGSVEFPCHEDDFRGSRLENQRASPIIHNHVAQRTFLLGTIPLH